jgi:hypothetical protein
MKKGSEDAMAKEEMKEKTMGKCKPGKPKPKK